MEVEKVTSLEKIRSVLYRWSHQDSLGIRIGQHWVGRPFDLQFKVEYINIRQGLRILFDRNYLDSTPAILSTFDVSNILLSDDRISLTSAKGYFSYLNLDKIWMTPTLIEILLPTPALPMH